ncbi:alpha/beta fold hydrolase [Haloferula chungangensis]|uniref:Alpha/beta fold hydrolase n=1 Tax=Haloferula chungangensis TaxID=1048331 RepID=A0ABW2LCT7_9BACT
MKLPQSLALPACLSLLCVLVIGCANFRKLGKDLKFQDESAIVTARITNAGSYKNIKGLTLNWDRETNTIASGDISEVKGIGVFGFFVKKSPHQYILAYSDSNGDARYQKGEPAWIHSDSNGNPLPLDLTESTPRRIEGALSSKNKVPHELITAATTFLAGRTVEEAKSGWDIPIALGEVANLSESRFSSETGSEGYWEPTGYTMNTGVGIYFLEKYDPKRIPVLFVYGAAGSPQDWSTFFKTFDRKRYQLWFYQYPSATRLSTSGGALDRGIQLLQGHYGFQEMNVVAHSMGGLVSRYAVINNYNAGHRYIKHFVTISSPFGGMEFAKSGVKHLKNPVPSWIDMVPNSDFQTDLFKTKLKGKIPYMLLYGDKASHSMVLPEENDGTVSVESVTRKEAVADAIKEQSFHEDHVSILSNSEVIKMVEDFLDN